MTSEAQRSTSCLAFPGEKREDCTSSLGCMQHFADFCCCDSAVRCVESSDDGGARRYNSGQIRFGPCPPSCRACAQCTARSMFYFRNVSIDAEACACDRLPAGPPAGDYGDGTVPCLVQECTCLCSRRGRLLELTICPTPVMCEGSATILLRTCDCVQTFLRANAVRLRRLRWFACYIPAKITEPAVGAVHMSFW